MVEGLTGPHVNERNAAAPIDGSGRVRADAISALVVALDAQGRILLWNRACEQLTGYSAVEAIGRQVWDFLIPDDAVNPVKRVFSDLVGEKLPSRFENAWVTRDGQIRWILWSNTFEPGPSGAEGLIISTGVDITDHRRTEDRLAEREAAVRELYEAASGGRTSDARIGALLEMGRGHFGMDIAIVARVQGDRYEVVAVEGGEVAGIRPGDVFDLGHTYCSVTLRAGGPVCFESASSTRWRRHPCFGKTRLEAYIAVPLRTGEHEYGTLSFSSLRPRSKPFVPADCDVIRLMGQWLGAELGRSRASRDAAVLAETAGILALSLDHAATARQVARIVAESVGDICVVDVLDDEGVIQRTAAAPAVAGLAGLAAELTGQRVPRDRPYITRAAIERGQCALLTDAGEPELRSLVAGGAELRLLHRLAPGSLMTSPLVARGHVQGALAVVRGRGRMRLDQDDARLIDQLAQRAALALDNARLYETATSAIRLRDEVTGVVAHDLRNPLTGIMLLADVLSRSADPEKTRSGMAKIRRAGERMDRLIQDLLDVTRLEAGALQIERERVLIEPVIEETLDVLRPLAAAGSVSIETVVDASMPPVLADRRRLLQVLANIGGNAVKFTPPGGRILVSARAFGSMLELSISDTGPGIGPDEIEHVFDRFWQGRTRERHGAGLGLAIAKGIVEAHGGRIRVSSVVGEGSTFTVALPRADAADNDIIDLPIDAAALDAGYGPASEILR